tara:strand:- start:417 stop:1013 length:597 start_codon:yes stop_codon:yes gene_type:complete
MHELLRDREAAPSDAHSARVAPVGNAVSKPLTNSHRAFGPRQQKHPSVRGQSATVECGSAVQRLHLERRMASARGRFGREDPVNPRAIIGRDPDVHRFHIFLEPRTLPCPGNRHDVLALCQKPRECQLGGSAALLTGHCLHLKHKIEVLLEVFPLEARPGAAVVILVQVLDTANLSGKETSPQRAVRNKTDAEFTYCG